jgi:hypothetical protein
MRDQLRSLLSGVVVGFLPWILMSVLEGPGRFEIAAGASFGLAVLIMAASAVLGLRPKLLDLAAIVFFLGLVLAGLLVNHHGQHWLDRWSGDLSNAILALAALASILVRRPFTLAYARESTDREVWDTPLFIRINYVITGVWTAVLIVIAIVGYIGDGPLHQPDNVWTNWIIQIGLIILAVRFTEWYPDYATERHEQQMASRHAALYLLRPVTAFLVPAGVAALVFNAGPPWVGIALIAVGIVLTNLFGTTGTPTAAG